jgi:putative sigma-54 modulation protein
VPRDRFDAAPPMLAGQTASKVGKKHAGRTAIEQTPVEIRDLDDAAVDRTLHDWVFQRLSRQLGKFAHHIERIDVRFGDVNGNKGGIDRSCLVHVILSALPPVVVEIVGETDREAFDIAAGRAERATQRCLAKHGFASGHKRRQRDDKRALRGGDTGTQMQPSSAHDRAANPAEPLVGKRAGHGRGQLAALQERPEKLRGDILIDAGAPDTGADQRVVGADHTGRRNTKLSSEGMAYALEDSTSGTPSRKSSRRSANRIKPASGLTLRTKSAVQSSKAAATRSRVRGH